MTPAKASSGSAKKPATTSRTTRPAKATPKTAEPGPEPTTAATPKGARSNARSSTTRSTSKQASPTTRKPPASNKSSSNATPPPAAKPAPKKPAPQRAARKPTPATAVEEVAVDQAPEATQAVPQKKATRGPYNVKHIESRAVTYRLPLDVLALIDEARSEAAAGGERLTHHEAVSRAVRWYYGKRRRR
ncbi:MAG: hypothetical protein QM598_05920 [Protaetiibacter sp.]